LAEVEVLEQGRFAQESALGPERAAAQALAARLVPAVRLGFAVWVVRGFGPPRVPLMQAPQNGR